MITSLAARRANQLGGEHIHRLFGIPVRNIEVHAIVDEALAKLTHDTKRQFLLSKLQSLIVEEISVVNAELWVAMDLLLQRVKENYAPFGGVFLLAHGDCMQLPNVSGCDVFQASSLLYGFNFNFLTHLVGMEDLNGQRLLLLMQQRPIPECDIEEIVQLFGDHCHFVDNWQNLDDSIMKVFGKKAAEREAVQRHLAMIQRSGAPHFFIIAKDEVRMSGSHAWRDAASDVTNFLDRNCQESPRLLIYERAVVRFCRNMDSKWQGTLGIIEYQNSTPNSVAVFIASLPSEINEENLRTGGFRNWRRVSVRRQNGFTQSFRGNSVRRQQIPLVNYVASNCHRLLGDEQTRLATAISTTESKMLCGCLLRSSSLAAEFLLLTVSIS